MKQSVSSPPQQELLPSPSRVQDEPHSSRLGIFALLAIVGLLLVLFSTQVVRYLPQAAHSTKGQIQTTPQATPQATTVVSPLLVPGNATTTPLQLSSGHSVLFEEPDTISMVSTSSMLSTPVEKPVVLNTPGFIYNRAVPPIVTTSGDLLYSGNGIWLTNITNGTPRQIAPLDPNQVITSMALSKDGSTLAWSTEPANGNGNVDLYAGPPGAATLVFQQSSDNCPCFRVFSFMPKPGQSTETTLLLTDDRGDHHSVRYGLWSLDLSAVPFTQPQPLLTSAPQQGPLTLMPQGNELLYSNDEGIVPAPTDGSAPSDIAAINYANSLSIAPIAGSPPTLGSSQNILLPQENLSNNADYRWVTTPRFSPDGHTLIYVEFSNDAQQPFDRHSALYSVQMNGSGTHHPQVLATSSALYVELGAWLDDHTLTLYSDRTLYALDIRNGSTAPIVQLKKYAHIIAVVGTSQLNENPTT